MKKYKITEESILCFARHLERLEYAQSSVDKYVRDLRAFRRWIGNRPVEKEDFVGWKAYLLNGGYRPETVNTMLSSSNKFFRFMGWDGYRMKYLRIQRKLFRGKEKELTKAEYIRLIETAREKDRERLALLMETICATGIRVSEVRYITIAALREGRADVALKGKVRTILIPGKLRRKLYKYAQKQKIVSGEIFLTRNGTGLSRWQIWAEMKSLCQEAGVAPSKVFPHNLRHLFARTFYRACRDVAKLADVLGHSSMETTRIYLLSTGVEHARQLERLGLIS